MSITPIQQWDNPYTSAATSLAVTVTGATANNLLLAGVTTRDTDNQPVANAGWTLLQSTTPTDTTFSTSLWYRWATGTSADDFSATWTESGRCYAIVGEYTGATFGQAPIISSDYAVGTGNDTVAVSPTTGTPGSDDWALVGFMGVYTWEQWPTSGTTMNGAPVDFGKVDGSTTLRPGMLISAQQQSANASVAASFSTTAVVGGSVWSVGRVGFSTLSGGVTVREMYTESGGSWVQSTPYMHIGGAWQEVEAHVRAGGSWVKVHDKG